MVKTDCAVDKVVHAERRIPVRIGDFKMKFKIYVLPILIGLMFIYFIIISKEPSILWGYQSDIKQSSIWIVFFIACNTDRI